jgi:N-acylglucosamine-6-phosphate 2-epimerase
MNAPTTLHPLIAPLRGGLVVSCQAYPGEPMRDPHTMSQVAASVERGGAVAVRAQGPEDITAVAAAVDVPVIGIWKDGADGVFITPTLDHARRVLDAGADVLALDGTTRPRPDRRPLAETIAAIRDEYGDVPIMADCDSVASALAAREAGADLIGTTLAGYTDARPRTVGPDLALIDELAAALPTGTPIVAEGRIHTPEQARATLGHGAFCVAVGTAITHPTTITGWFADAVGGRR